MRARGHIAHHRKPISKEEPLNFTPVLTPVGRGEGKKVSLDLSKVARACVPSPSDVLKIHCASGIPNLKNRNRAILNKRLTMISGNITRQNRPKWFRYALNIVNISPGRCGGAIARLVFLNTFCMFLLP